MGTYTLVGTYTQKGAFTPKGTYGTKGTYETKGTFLTYTLFSAVPLAKAAVAETGYAPQRVTLLCPQLFNSHRNYEVQSRPTQ
jgi:hypothetical protein